MDLLSEKRIVWPNGAVTRLNPDFAAEISVDVWNRRTIIDMPALTAATELDLVPDAELEDGAEVIVNVDQDATGRNVALGANIVGDDLVGVANDKDTLVFVYSQTDGNFRLVSKTKLVDAA